MSGHPDRETLQTFLRSGLPAEQTRAVLRHLAMGCRRCQEAMEPYATAMFQPGLQEPELTPELDAAYDAAIASACTRILSQHTALIARQELGRKVSSLLRGTPPPEAPGFWTLDLFEALLEKSRELRHDDPDGMLRLAELAQQAADRLDPAEHGARETLDLQARAWAELANAWRVREDLPQAEEAMARALALADGTGSTLLRARLAELRASLLCDQRQFPEAFRLLDEAHALYTRRGDAHGAGRVLITKGLYTGYMGDPRQALPLLAEGLAAIDRERDPRLAFHTLHNALLFRVELGELEEARRQIQRMRPLYTRHAGASERTKLRIIEGKIAAGLGDLARAEELFLETRRGVDAAGLGYLAALVSLELAAVWLRQGRRDEARRLVTELVTVFRSIGVEREAMAALALLGEAVNKDQSTLELLALISGALRQLHGSPGLLVDPEPV